MFGQKCVTILHGRQALNFLCKRALGCSNIYRSHRDKCDEKCQCFEFDWSSRFQLELLNHHSGTIPGCPPATPTPPPPPARCDNYTLIKTAEVLFLRLLDFIGAEVPVECTAVEAEAILWNHYRMHASCTPYVHPSVTPFLTPSSPIITLAFTVSTVFEACVRRYAPALKHGNVPLRRCSREKGFCTSAEVLRISQLDCNPTVDKGNACNAVDLFSVHDDV